MATPPDRSRRTWVRRRLVLVGSALSVGLLVGALAMVLATAATGDPRATETTVFALGGLALSLGLLGWSGSILAGPGIENMQRYMDTGRGWSEDDSRRAMARIGGFGAGVMLGTSVAAGVVRAVGVL